MPFEFFELEDNFCPNYVADPYRRKHIRVRYSLKQGESMADAEKVVEDYISEYIYKNTLILHDHIEVRNVDVPLPEIQVEKEELQSLPQLMGECKTEEELQQYFLMAQGVPEWAFIYKAKMKKLQQHEKV